VLPLLLLLLPLLFLLVATVYNSSHISHRLGNGAFLSDCAHIQ
jgi:hypothetical protein